MKKKKFSISRYWKKSSHWFSLFWLRSWAQNLRTQKNCLDGVFWKLINFFKNFGKKIDFLKFYCNTKKTWFWNNWSVGRWSIPQIKKLVPNFLRYGTKTDLTLTITILFRGRTIIPVLDCKEVKSRRLDWIRIEAMLAK